jgi:hypothetical protein
MEDQLKLELNKTEAEQLATIIAEVIAAIDQAGERMAKEQEEIARLRTETDEILRRDWRGGINVEAILGSFSASPVPHGNYRNQ